MSNEDDVTKTLTMKNAKLFAQYLGVFGVCNNTDLEDLHSGITPSSKTGDDSDVYVVSSYGEIER